MFSEEDLRQYVHYWGATLDMLERSYMSKTNARVLAPIIFYLLHHPERYPQLNIFWKRTVNQIITNIWTELRCYAQTSLGHCRTRDVKEYLEELLNLWISSFGAKRVFQMRYQNWYVLPVEVIYDQLWTVLEITKENEDR